MDCDSDACVDVGDYDMLDVDMAIVHSPRAAVCDECGASIEPHHAHERATGQNDFVHVTCTDCLSIRDRFFCDGYIYGEILSELWDAIHSCEGRAYPCYLTGLTPRALEMVCEMIHEVWEDLERWEDDAD